MKKNNLMLLIACITALFSSCKKEGDNIFNMFTDVTVDLNNNDPRNITGYKIVKVNDEVWIDYTITSNKEDMYTLNLLEVGTITPTKIEIDASQRRKATGIIKLKATLRTGPVSYRLYPTNKIGVYMGDGGKLITMDVANDFNFDTERFITLPNTTFGIDPVTSNPIYENIDDIFNKSACFYSAREAKAYTYPEGAANSAKIDFGIYYKPKITKQTDNSYKIEHFYYAYSPGVLPSPLPFTGFDFTTWTKKGTLFSAPVSNSLFVNMRTGQQIAEGGKKVAVNLTNAELKSGSATYFLTPDGKYGMIYVLSLGSDRNHRGLYLNISSKVQL